MNTKKLGSLIAVAALAVSACSGTTSTTQPPTASASVASPSASASMSESPSASESASASASASASGIGVSSFDSAFTAMAQLKSIHDAGSGFVGVVLPDTTSSNRYVDFDAPYLDQAFKAAGYSSSEYKIQNAQGNDATELAMVEAYITQGAKVIIMDPLNGNVGKQVQAKTSAANVKLISYDRATFAGTDTYYVSFDNVQVGKLIGQGFMDCVKAWNVSSPKVFTLDGGQDTDPNAIDFAKGYNSVIWGQEVAQVKAGATNSQGMTLVGEQIAPKWDNAAGGTVFEQQFTAHKEINATVEANDGLANAVIQVLKRQGAPAKKVPTTGQDATLQGMQNVLQGYQCGSVYKAVYLEAQDAVALATYLRAGQTPPSTLLNGKTTDPTNSSVSEPASLLTPQWVDASNMAQTVIKDKFVDAKALCAAAGVTICSGAGITVP